FGLERYLRQRFQSQIDRFTQFVVKTAKIEELAHPTVELIGYSAIALVFFVGGSGILRGQSTLGDFIAFLLAFGLMIDPIRRLNNANIKLNQAAAAAERINAMLNWKSHLDLT